MASLINFDSLSPTFFPPGSLESQLDSFGTGDFPVHSSRLIDSPKPKKIIKYIEVNERKVTPKNRIGRSLEDSKTPAEKTQKFSKREKDLWKESSLFEESNLLENSNQDIQEESLRLQLNLYKALVNEYESTLKIFKEIFENIKALSVQDIKLLPVFDDSSLKNARQSLEKISFCISNIKIEKSVKKNLNEAKKIKCLKLDNVYPSILIQESPEPPKQANLMKRQESVAKDEKKSKNEGLFMINKKIFKSVSPILKVKNKSIPKSRC